MPFFMNGSLQYFADVRAANAAVELARVIGSPVPDLENHEALTAERTLPARTALSVGEG